MKSKNEVIEFLEHSNYIEREYGDLELEKALQAWSYAYQERGNFTLDYIMKVHKRLIFHKHRKIAGKIRDCTVYIGSETKDQSKELIEQQLNSWIEKYNERRLYSEEEIKQSHVEFEKIHPFVDGNGRVGRILMNIQRLKSNLPILIIHQGKEQFEYYEWFRD